MEGWRNTSLPQTVEFLEIYNAYAAENPVFIEAVLKRRPTAIKLTDYLPFQKFSRTNIYNEFYKLAESDTQLAITLPVSSEFNLTCLLTRHQTDFSERDRLIMNLITPHLINAIKNSFIFERLNSALAAKECGVVSIDGDGKSQFVSEFARLLLKKYFADDKTENLLPETLRGWVKRSDSSETNFSLPPAPLKVRNDSGELSVRLIYNSATRERTLLLEEQKAFAPEMLESLGLTKRETEILFWIMQGKTDNQIAKVCHISPLTVQKHAQNIYIKLGVETRTAATLTALEILRH